MSLTNFPNGASSFGVPLVPGGIPFGGDVWFVRPSTGLDGNTGDTPDAAFKTLSYALSRATANQNDVVFFIGEGNSSALSTDYQSVTLDWNKDMVHLIGVGASPAFSGRSRVAFTSLYNTASNLFTLSANACLIANMHFFAGVAGTLPTGCVKQTGDRNKWVNCHFAGIGNDANDIAGAYSLYLSGVQNTEFIDCMIGLDTIDAGTAANSEILLASTIQDVCFTRCKIFRRIEHETNHPLVKIAAATSIDQILWFDEPSFVSFSTNRAYSNASPFKFVAAPTSGEIMVRRPFLTNGVTAGKWDVDDYNRITVLAEPTPAADTTGIALLV